MPEPLAFKYRAFLSYAHADTRWGRWLHRALERYPIGKDISGTATERGPVPSSLRPIFRDREDFTGGHTLEEATVAALNQSASLVVLCSRRSASRPAVNEEVRLFRWLHPERPVIPVFIDGTYPDNVPPALRYVIASDGTLTDQPINILGPDLRDNADGKSVGLAKIVAGITGLPTDTFVRRAERDRRRRQRNWIAGLTTVLVALAGLAVWADINRREAVLQRGVAEQTQQVAERERDQALVTQSRFLADVADRTTRDHDPVSAALIALEGLPDGAAGRMRPYVAAPELALYQAFVAAREVSLMSGHIDSVFRATLGPDGKHIATASADGTSRVFDWRTGRLIAVLEGHTNRVVDVAFSPDGSKLLTASLDGTARLWNAATGGNICVFQGHTFDVKRAKFNPSGGRAVTASGDNSARTWDITSCRAEHWLKGHHAYVWDAQYSPDGKLVATASGDHTARLWNSETGVLVAVLGGHTDQVEAVQFSPDGKLLLTRSQDKTARVYNVETGNLVSDLVGHGAHLITSRFSPDGNLVATGDDAGDVRLWSLPEGRQVTQLVGHKERIHEARFNRAGSLLATAGADATVRIWDVTKGQLLQTFKGHIEDAYSVLFLDDDRVLSTGKDGTIRVWSLRPVRFLELTGHQGAIKAVRFSPDGRLVATASDDRTARVWDAKTGKAVMATGAHKVGLQAISFNRDATILYTGEVGRIRAWSVSSGTELDGWEAFANEEIEPNISLLALSTDGKTLAAWSHLKVKLFDVKSRNLVRELVTKEFVPLTLEFVPDNSALLTSGFGPVIDDGTVSTDMRGRTRLWKLSGASESLVIDDKPGMVFASFGLNPDQLWISSEDGWVRQHHLPAGTVGAMAFVRDAQFVSQSRASKLIGLSRFKAPTAIRRVLSEGDVASTGVVPSDIWRLEFSPDGKSLATAHADEIARVWPLFETHNAVMNEARSRAPRCLTLDQRRAAFLSEIPPAYCLEGKLWPYDSTEWSEWRRRSLAGEIPALPDRRGRLGVIGTTMTKEIAEANDLAMLPGAVVTNLVEKGAADRAGVQIGDIIVKVGDEAIMSMEQLANAVGWKEVGRPIALQLVRKGTNLTLDVTLDPYVRPQSPKPDGAVPEVAPGEQAESPGERIATPEQFSKRMSREDGSAIYWTKERRLKEAKDVDDVLMQAHAAAQSRDYPTALRMMDRVISSLSFQYKSMNLGAASAHKAKSEAFVARLFSDLSWYAALAGQPRRALLEMTKARSYNFENASIKLNYANALLVNGRVEDAKSIYRAGRGTRMDSGATWEDTAAEDLLLLKSTGHVMAEIDGIVADLKAGQP